MSTELQTIAAATPMDLLQRALSVGIPAAELERLAALQERWEQNRAAEAFADALLGFRTECPQIVKRKEAKGKGLAFLYAAYDDIDRIARPIMNKRGIVASYTTADADKAVKVICRIRVGAHMEETECVVPVPEGVVNSTQLKAQAFTYARRYALCLALDIVVTDEDTDGSFSPELVTEEQLVEINSLLSDLRESDQPVDMAKLLRWVGVDALDKIPQTDFGKVTGELKRRFSKGAT